MQPFLFYTTSSNVATNSSHSYLNYLVVVSEFGGFCPIHDGHTFTLHGAKWNWHLQVLKTEVTWHLNNQLNYKWLSHIVKIHVVACGIHVLLLPLQYLLYAQVDG